MTPLLDRLMRLPGDLPDLAFAEALPSADPVTRAHLVDILLERSRQPGLEGLVRCFDALPAEQQQRVIARVADLGSALRAVTDDPDHQAKLNVVDIVSRAAAVELSYLLVRLLHWPDSRLTRAAAAELSRLARRQFSAARPTTADARRRRHLVLNAVIDACACFHQHRRRDVLVAAACFLPGFDPRLARYTLDHRAPAYRMFCETVSHADQLVICRGLLPLAGVDSMQDAVVRGLGQPAVGERLDLVLRFGHLLAAPRVRHAIRAVKRTDHLLPTHARLERLNPAAARHVPAWLAALPLNSAVRIEGLAVAAAHTDALTRLAALRELIAERGRDADDVIATLCFDHQAPIARIALRHLVRRRYPRLDRLIVQLMTSEHAAVRDMAERQLGPVGFARYWANWANMTPATRLTAGRALIKVDPQFSRNLDAKLHADASDQRLRAVMIVRRLNQVDYHEPSLLALVDDIDPRVASAAVRALGGLADSRRAARAVRAALDHDDDRVRANAIESLEAMQRTADVADKLHAIAAGQGNRSRAAAIKALLQLPADEALAQLERMLSDPSEPHRVSALWVVERLGLVPLIESVARLARHDHQPAVRRRAGRVVRDIAAAHLQHHHEAG